MKYIVLIPAYEPDDKLIKVNDSIDKSVDIVLVNDGSSKKYDSIFESVEKKVHLISYKENKGKGYALKKGFKYIKENYDNYVVVTMDADMQHTFNDAKKLLKYVKDNPRMLAIGKRHWDKTMPKSSRFGNYITRKIYKKTTNIDIYDTQSGLRAFSNENMDYMLLMEGNRYEYEMNVLLHLKEYNIDVKEIDIETIYINKNETSHYRTIKDSYRIYKVIKESRKHKWINKLGETWKIY